MSLQVIPIHGIGAVRQGEDVATVIISALEGTPVHDGDVLVVTHKIVSKAEGAVAVIQGDEEEFRRALIDAEAVSIVRRRGDLVIAETKHGFICANAGIDRSNAEPGTMVLLPDDPDRSAHRIRQRFGQALGVDIGVIISDTFGRAWRRGLTDVAIGISGVEAVRDLKGETDWSGRTLEVTEVAVADELAAAADLVMGKSQGLPAALIKGHVSAGPSGKGADLTRPAGEDLFR